MQIGYTAHYQALAPHSVLHITESLFSVAVELPVEKLATLVLTFKAEGPGGIVILIVINEQGG